MNDEKFFECLSAHLSAFEKMGEILPQIKQAVSAVEESLKNGGKVIVFGNGGSAADAQHFATELVCKFAKVRDPLPAISLTTNTSLLTATGNDFGFRYIFSRQVQAVGKPQDVAIAISTSGNSENVIEAVSVCKKKGIKTIGLLGFDGGKLKGLCDIAVLAPGENVARIQESHIFILHFICSILEEGGVYGK